MGMPSRSLNCAIDLRALVTCGLAGDQGEVADSAVDQLGVLGGISNTHVHNNLHQAGNLVHVRVVEFVLQRLLDGLCVLRLQTRNDLRFDCGGLSH
jgi:hypothetical protein